MKAVNIHTLSNSELLQKLKALVIEERTLLVEVLNHLREVERRKLYADEGYPSLFEYCVRGLGYSSSAAFRRISAMRLIKDLPTVNAEIIQQKISSGCLNLTQISLAQEYFKREEKLGTEVPLTKKVRLLERLEGQSSRECERMIVEQNPVLAAAGLLGRDTERVLTPELTEIKFVVSEALLKKLKRIRELKSHINPSLGYAELLELMADEVLKKSDPLTKKDPLPAPEVKAKSPSIQSTSHNSGIRFIPARFKRLIYRRDHGACTYPRPDGSKCGSRHLIQIDHIQPISLGGDSKIENLRLLCFTHNQSEARRKLATRI